MATATHRKIRTRLVGAALALGTVTGVGAGIATAPSASAAVTINGVTSYSFPTWDACNHLVTAGAMTNENAYGRYSVQFRMAVYDTRSGQWYWTNWLVEDGRNRAAMYINAPGSTVYMQYAKVVNGAWAYNGEYLYIDASGASNVWCSQNFGF